MGTYEVVEVKRGLAARLRGSRVARTLTGNTMLVFIDLLPAHKLPQIKPRLYPKKHKKESAHDVRTNSIQATT